MPREPKPDPEYIMLDLPDGMPPVCCMVRRSLKAKRFLLRVCPRPFYVELAIPKKRSVASALKFCESRIVWLAATIRRYGPRPEIMSRKPAELRRIPEKIELELTGETLRIAVEEMPGSEKARCWYDPLFKQITIQGDPANTKAVAKAFLALLTQFAEPVLKARLHTHAAVMGLPVYPLRVRPEKTRWGCCFSAGPITLNSKLILFPPEAVDYVIVHELCHKFEMNHSERFKKKLEKYCPEWRLADSILRECARNIPFFLH